MKGKGELRIEGAMAGNTVTMKMRDSGPGIPKEILPHIFEEYFTTKKDSESVGIGLSMAKHQMERLGGSVEVHSTAGKGAEFILRFQTANQRVIASKAKDPQQ